MSKVQIAQMLVNLLGGLAFLLFGMSYINSSLQKAAGQKFRSILASLASSRLKGVFSGFSLTALNQSSSATMLLAVSLVGGGLMTFFQSMSVSLGASIGSTVTGQLVAFRLSHYAVAIIAAGFFISFIFNGKRAGYAGRAVFGFGILFYAMKLMSDALAPIAADPYFIGFIARIETPVFSILAGIAITMIMQSSGAVVGMIIAFATSGVLTLEQAVSMALGSQIGTCITVVLGSFYLPRNAKRIVIWQILQQTAAVIMIYPFLSFFSVNGEGAWFVFVKWFAKTFFFSESLGRQIAMSHTLAAVLNAAVMLPFLPYLQKAAYKIYPFKEEEMTFGTIYIDIKNIEKNADKALLLLNKEMQRMCGFVFDMFSNSIKAVGASDLSLAEHISYKGVRISILNKEIIPYIAKVGQKRLTGGQSRQEIRLLYILSDLAEIADIIDRNIMNIAKKKIGGFIRFSDEGWQDIKKLHALVDSNFAKLLNAFETGDKDIAKEVSQAKRAVKQAETELKQKHIARLHADLKESIESSGLHMEILDQYTRINSLVCDIGRVISTDN
ncbi:MAG: Na/Pi cotransporter family protein [Endomicrobium sp.]|jgi:phosphate:Na+ symporter|nr:Na/Pi cotransporter family protein [Endomicrobium sp.]